MAKSAEEKANPEVEKVLAFKARILADVPMLMACAVKSDSFSPLASCSVTSFDASSFVLAPQTMADLREVGASAPE